jgi:photosystem II stability/assembly factor-like uncharacterized protein
MEGTMRNWRINIGLLAVATFVLGGCMDTPSPQTTTAPKAPHQVVAENQEKEPTPVTAPRESKADTALPGGVSQAASAKFKSWGVVHSFLGSNVVRAKVISATEGIALTKDNLVGVTTNGGNSWSFIKHANGVVLSVAGVPGGPYIVAGKLGYVAISRDGKQWVDQPRMIEDALLALTIHNGTVVAVGKRGGVLRFGTDGSNAFARLFPDKFKAKGITIYKGAFLALKGKKGYSSADGKTWTQMVQMPKFGKGKTVATSRGVCSIGKVGKSKGMVCAVKGIAHGISQGVGFVVTKKEIAFTNNNGGGWNIAPAPFKGVTKVIGNAKGPYYALGKKCGLALNTSKTLQTGIIAGTNIVIVGDSGTIVRSADNGESWTVLPAPMSGSFKSIVNKGGKLIIPVKKTAIQSGDGGLTWNEVMDPAVAEGLSKPGKPGDCGARLPRLGETCKFNRAMTTPLGLPKIRSFHFKGDTGLAVGDQGLVAFTSDGGATWKARRGFKFKGFQGFALRGSRIVAIGGKTVIYSVDGGKSFREAQLPKKIGKIASVFIASDGSVYGVGTKGTILKSTGNLTTWLPLFTYPKNKTKYVAMFEVNNVLYAVGKKGEIDRSDNKGARWRVIPTGVKSRVWKMTGEGNTVLAVAAAPNKKSGNLLLRSNNGGLRFAVQGQISNRYRVDKFWLKGGKLRYNNRVSSDFGSTWVQAEANFVYYTTDAGNGIRIKNRWANFYGKPTFTVYGPTDDDWTIVDSFYNKDAWFRCDGTTGCWMISRGQVYRPL